MSSEGLAQLLLCSTKNCKLARYIDDKCILCCDKKDESKINRALLSHFNDALADYVSSLILSKEKIKTGSRRSKINGFLLGHNPAPKDIDLTLENNIINIHDVFFPTEQIYSKKNIPFYIEILEHIPNVKFVSCTIMSNNLCGYRRTHLSFSQCSFYEALNVFSHMRKLDELSENIDVLYHQCRFHDDVKVQNTDNYTINFPNKIFHSCTFDMALMIYNFSDDAQLFADDFFVSDTTPNLGSQINSLTIFNCYLKHDFMIDRSSIGDVNILNCVFEGKYSARQSTIGKSFCVATCKFKDVFDLAHIDTKGLSICLTTFEELAVFENASIRGIQKSDKEHPCVRIFQSTFEKHASFRGCTIYDALDLSTANFLNTANFFNAKIEKVNTNRETNRILKYSFNSIGNHIEANKYYSREMSCYRDEMKDVPWHDQEKIIFLLSGWLSNFGQSWKRPLALIIVLMIIFSALSFAYEKNWPYSLGYETFNLWFERVSYVFNSFAKTYLPLAKFLKHGMEFVSLVFSVGLAILTWNLITTVKMRIKR